MTFTVIPCNPISFINKLNPNFIFLLDLLQNQRHGASAFDERVEVRVLKLFVDHKVSRNDVVVTF